MEGDIAFDFLQRLMNVAVQHGDRSKWLEKLERLRRVVRAPAPLRIDRPQGNVREDDDGRALWKTGQILLQPIDLLLTEHAEAAFLDRRDIDQPDEVNALLIEAEPAAAARTFSEPFQILRAIVAQDVVLARHIEDLFGFAVLEHLLQVVEFLGFRKLRQIAGVNDEIRRHGQRIDARDGFAKRGADVGVRRLVKADVAVADLDEVERGPGSRFGGIRG